MTTVIARYVHAYQSICLAGRPMTTILHHKFRLFAAKTTHPHFPNSLTRTREKSMISMVGAVYCDGGIRYADGENFSWLGRSLDGRIYIMFCPDITTESTSRVYRDQNPLQKHR